MKVKRIVKKGVAILMAVLCGSTFMMSAFASEKEDRTVDQIKKKIVEIEKDLEEQMEGIRLNEWPVQDAFVRLTDFVDSPEGTPFRADYGGAWMNEAKQLVINVKGGEKTSESAFLKAADYEKTVICPCRYSLQELRGVYSRMDSLYRENELQGLSVFGISETKNKVTVVLLHNDETAREAFLKWVGVSDAEMFDFSEGSSPMPATTVCAGASVTPMRSVGYRGYRIADSGNGYTYGFSSCGHSIVDELFSGSTKVGKLKAYSFGGNADFAFYDKVGNSTLLSNMLAYTDDEGNCSGNMYLSAYDYLGLPVENYTVYKVGATTYLTSGVLTNSSVTTNGISDMFTTTAYSALGDSGCVMFFYYQGQRYVIGSLHAGGNYNGVHISFYSKYTHNKNALPFIVYRY